MTYLSTITTVGESGVRCHTGSFFNTEIATLCDCLSQHLFYLKLSWAQYSNFSFAKAKLWHTKFHVIKRFGRIFFLLFYDKTLLLVCDVMLLL